MVLSLKNTEKKGEPGIGEDSKGFLLEDFTRKLSRCGKILLKFLTESDKIDKRFFLTLIKQLGIFIGN